LQERLSKVLRQERLESIPAQEMSLRWQFFSSPELDQEGAAVNRQGIEFKRLQQVQEFYLLNDEKKLFYTRLQRELPLLVPEPLPGKELQAVVGFIRKPGLWVAYALLPLEKTTSMRAFFGFQIVLAQIQQVLFPALQKRYWSEAGPELVLSTKAEASALAAENLPQLALEKLLPGYVLAIKAPYRGYLETRIQKELLVNYVLIAALLLTLLVAVYLFFRSLRRDLELLELKNRFLDSAAHTLKTPLARIRMLAEQLQLNWLKNEEQRAAQSGRIIAEADRMNDLISNLLDLSRIEAGQKTYRFQPASLPEIAKQAWAEALPLLKENGFACRAEIAEEMPVFAFDARAMRMVIGNLIQNALNYSPGHKEIELKVYTENGEAVLEVADNGLGIAPEYHEVIFRKFFRIETAETSASQGSGLGLFLVKHVVDAHSGRIEVQSTPGQGARFIIHLPMTNAASHQEKKGSHHE
jgi:signal transduction histidine kinase